MGTELEMANFGKSLVSEKNQRCFDFCHLLGNVR